VNGEKPAFCWASWATQATLKLRPRVYRSTRGLNKSSNMLDFFVIFSKGGIVLWCCQGAKDIVFTSVNALIRSVILQERSGNGSFDQGSLMLQYKLDNEFELVFVAAFQKILQLSYVDKFLDDMHREIRDRYKNNLGNTKLYFDGLQLDDMYAKILRAAEIWSFEVAKQPKSMRSYEESRKSKKTVASMIDRPGDNIEKKKKKEKQGGNVNNKSVDIDLNENEEEDEEIPEPDNNTGAYGDLPAHFLPSKFSKKGTPSPGPGKGSKATKSPKPGAAGKAGKKPTQWEFGGSSKDAASLDRTKDGHGAQDFVPDTSIVGKSAGGLKSLEIKRDIGNKENSGGVINLFKGLVGGKTLSSEDTEPVLEKLRDHLIAKNVASEVSTKLCESVATKLHGKVLGTFKTVTATVKSALEESLLALLQPEKPVDVLRDALEAKRQGRPFIITFCGVNGVGKSTNLAKICFWLIENDLKVLVAACDTFRAGAVEQLRTHARHLNALHPPKNGQPCVELYEKGYGKDAAGVASEAISFAKEARKDVVLVDTAGRMQDNEPLMRAMAKLIRVNDPDLVLFVGEALVGNEAVDQLVKFNRALADFSDQANPRLIDGIVLTKFDTIDDKVGAAISMAYITGKPIVFVGTGQTYTDLRSLDSQAVVSALMN